MPLYIPSAPAEEDEGAEEEASEAEAAAATVPLRLGLLLPATPGADALCRLPWIRPKPPFVAFLFAWRRVEEEETTPASLHRGRTTDMDADIVGGGA